MARSTRGAGKRRWRLAWLGAAAVALPATASPTGGEAADLTSILLALVIILAGARVAAGIVEALHQPAVLGELLWGIALGNLDLLGVHQLDWLATDHSVEVLAELGVILLLFEVGLESNVSEMLAVGKSSLAVAVLGVVAPMLGGLGLATIALPEEHVLAHVFVGATLAATSVGITARVLADLGRLQSRESRIILGAAVIDDVLGLILLAVVGGLIAASNSGGVLSGWAIAVICIKAIGFLLGAVVLGSRVAPALYRGVSHLHGRGLLLATTLVICLGFSWIASELGLAAIVGAFAAGLILDEVHYRPLADREETHHHIEDMIQPLSGFMVPIFFVMMGFKVDLSTFGDVKVLGFALTLTAIAIVGKLASAGGVLEPGVDRLSVAVGMVPRGEVGLIFAGIGAKLSLGGHPVISASLFSAIVIMVVLTTLVTPPALKLTLSRSERRLQPDGGSTRGSGAA
jgi:Kef-type K+ transport system membrane component KefB